MQIQNTRLFSPAMSARDHIHAACRPGGVVMEARTLTLATLKSKGACAPKVALFRKMFGKSVQITEALCVEHASAFSWKWAAENLLTASAQDAYEAARASTWARAYISDVEIQP